MTAKASEWRAEGVGGGVRLVLVAVLCAVFGLLVEGRALAQHDPDSVSIVAPSSAARCSEIEVVVSSVLPGGHESASLRNNGGARLIRSWTEKCGWGAGPCNLGGWGIGEWNPAIGYRGPMHFVLEVVSPVSFELWVEWDDGNVGPPYYRTTSHRVAVTPGPTGAAVYVSPDSSSLVADGAQSTPVRVRCRTGECGVIPNVSGTLSTSLGVLSIGATVGPSIGFVTGSDGRATAALTSSTTPGIATITGSAAGLAPGTATVRMEGYTLSLVAEPEGVPADGHTPSLLTATLVDPLVGPMAGETIQFTTDQGTLVVTPGGSGSTSVTATTGTLGTAMVLLIPTTTPTTPDKATVTATWSRGSLVRTATAQVEFEGYTLEVTGVSSKYQRVPGRSGGNAYSAQTDVVVPGALATRYGRTKISMVANLARGSSPPSAAVANKRINLRSPQRDLLGSAHVSLEVSDVEVSSVTTNASGEATFDLVVENLWQAATHIAAVTVNAEFAEDPTVTATLTVETRGNLQLVASQYAAGIPSGPILGATVRAEAESRLSGGYGLQLFRDLAVWPGLQNDLLASGVYDYVKDPTWNARFLDHSAPYYQWQVLSLLHALQWGPFLSGGAGGSIDNRWLLNGLDWAPLFVEGGTHTAVVLYPRTADGRSPAEWQSAEAIVLDPWLTQQAATYGWSEWLGLLADPQLQRAGSGVEVQAHEFVAGQFGGTDSPSYHYPANHGHSGYYGYYYDWNEAVAAPYAAGHAGSWVENFVEGWRLVVRCPVYVTLSDAQGRRSGYAAPPDASPLADEIPGVQRTLLAEDDGTLLWSFVAPSSAMTMRVEAYGSGPMVASLVRPDLGTIWTWDTTVTQGEVGTLSFAASSTSPPVLSFTGGRTVPATVTAVLAAGVTPATGLPIGGTRVAVTGLDVRPGVAVTIGGQPATGVEIVNGTTLIATTPHGSAGAATVVVTNPSGAPVSLGDAFTYEPAAVYFAEGATGTVVQFETAIALLNPDPTLAAAVHLRFLKSDGSSASHDVTVPALGRATVDAAAVLGPGTHEFSIVVESDTPVVADRTMVWDGSVYGSHTETAVPSPATRWYLAEGATHSNFDLFYLLQNATASVAQVQVTYLRPSPQAPVVRTYTVGPHSRYNIWVDLEGPELANTDVSAVIEVTNAVPIVVERAMYLNGGGRQFSAGHESAGVTQPATRWFLAEGATGNYFDLFVLIANPGATAAQVRATYLLPDGTTYAKDYAVGPQSRFNLWVDLEQIPEGSGVRPLADTSVSTIVESLNGVPIIVERAMWWPGPTAATWAEAHNSPGATETGTMWALAEGEQGGPRGIETYILVANTSTTAGEVTVTLLFEDGGRAARTFVVPASSRFNVNLPAYFPSEFPPGSHRRFGAIVERVGTAAIEIVVERAMYSNADGVPWAAGTNARATRIR